MVFLRELRHFLKFSTKTLNREYYWRPQILGNKSPKCASSNVRDSLKFGKISRKDLLCRKMEKTGYREFDHSGTLTRLKRNSSNCILTVYLIIIIVSFKRLYEKNVGNVLGLHRLISLFSAEF